MVNAVGDGTEPTRVLVVENFGQLREMLVHELTEAGFAVDGADSVRQARSLHPETYDALVVDDRLGDGSGVDLLLGLREQDETVASRFILMTGDDRGVELPAEVPVLVKPFRIAALADALRQVLLRSGVGKSGSGGSRKQDG